jgi:endonuclease/exonuclease/phosphatase family metal-dependent hydrolase
MRALTVMGVLVAAVGADVLLAQRQSRPSFLARAVTGELRVLTFNIGDDLIFPDPGKRIDPDGLDGPSRFLRMARAIQPDLLCLQEATVGSERAVETLNEVLPPGIGSTWYAHHAVDNVIAARYPLSMLAGGVVEAGDKRRGHATALVDLPDASYDRDLYVVCVHNQSGAGALNVALRQRQADIIARWIHDAKTPGGMVTLRPGTPIVVLGDMNVIDDPALYLRTILTGDIADERQFGPDFHPDWDDTDLTDAYPSQNGAGRTFYTWRNDTQRFPPGALDRVLYTDSVLEAVNSFVLNTTTMSKEELREAGMRRADVHRDPRRDIHDHMPVVVDFVVRRSGAQ